jgi:glyoxylase-like metal-dependent hydrolase (beta-lactamase superfamily II)
MGISTPTTSKLNSPPITSFTSGKVNASTFLIVEDDRYGEGPFIYVKLYEKHIVITDTGCNAPRSNKPSLTSLRKYLETYPLAINNGQCLNPNGKKEYVIICSHCHYDHILGIPQFLSAKPTIVCSWCSELAPCP